MPINVSGWFTGTPGHLAVVVRDGSAGPSPLVDFHLGVLLGQIRRQAASGRGPAVAGFPKLGVSGRDLVADLDASEPLLNGPARPDRCLDARGLKQPWAQSN
jgi:hypothetical protein